MNVEEVQIEQTHFPLDHHRLRDEDLAKYDYVDAMKTLLATRELLNVRNKQVRDIVVHNVEKLNQHVNNLTADDRAWRVKYIEQLNNTRLTETVDVSHYDRFSYDDIIAMMRWYHEHVKAIRDNLRSNGMSQREIAEELPQYTVVQNLATLWEYADELVRGTKPEQYRHQAAQQSFDVRYEDVV